MQPRSARPLNLSKAEGSDFNGVLVLSEIVSGLTAKLHHALGRVRQIYSGAR